MTEIPPDKKANTVVGETKKEEKKEKARNERAGMALEDAACGGDDPNHPETRWQYPPCWSNSGDSN